MYKEMLNINKKNYKFKTNGKKLHFSNWLLNLINLEIRII